jgi:hypothetical protein
MQVGAERRLDGRLYEIHPLNWLEAFYPMQEVYQ